MSAHTPTPWVLSRNNAGMIPLHFQPPEILGRSGNCCVASQFGSGPEAEANAEFIVQACNSHDQLVAKLLETAERCETAARYIRKQVECGAISQEHSPYLSLEGTAEALEAQAVSVREALKGLT